MNGQTKFAYTHNGILASETKDILTPATMWVNLEGITLNEMSQTQEDKYCMSHFYAVPRAVRFIETEGRWGSQGLGEGVVV